MALGTRAIARIQGSGTGGFAAAKKMADLYAAKNTNDSGQVKDPGVYDTIINDILAPYAGTLDGQNLIADYTNKKKQLVSAKNEVDTTVSSFRQKEYDAWFVSDDPQDTSVSFRNPQWVAKVTSESLDMILAEALESRDMMAAQNKSTAELDSYINELSRRSDRMRSVSTQLADGGEANLDGYGYYVDADPNTGVIRGASFMPTDVNFKDLAERKMRTTSTVDVNGKKVPVYLPYVELEDGKSRKAMFGGVEYTGDTTLLEGGEEVTALTDSTRYNHALASIEVNKIYQTFTGKVNIDGSQKKDYIYVSPENKVYRFGEDDARGKELIDSLRNIAGVNDIPRISPTDAQEFYAQPLPDDSAGVVQGMNQYVKKLTTEAATENAVVEAQRVQNRGSLDLLKEATVSDGDSFGRNVMQGVGVVAERIGSFFGRKNKPNKPDQASASVGGQTQGNEVIAQGESFFRNKA
jgi:hypothetical protein